MQPYRLELIDSEELTPTVVLQTIRGPEIAAQAVPGQFVNIRPSTGTDPLLRRPISIAAVNRIMGTFSILVKRIGPGTRLLAERRPGTKVDVIGPLGRGFEWTDARRMVLVAGGVGVAPMLFLAREAVQRQQPPEITFCYGARTAGEFVLLDQIEQTAGRLVLATEDGSRGHHGFVTEAAEPLLEPGTSIATCGPNPMMDDLMQRMRARGLEGQVSLENQMGCGIGACQGCVVPTRRGYIRICCDGPVLPTVWFDTIRFD